MSGHGCYSQRILDYVWENWEHAIEGMRYQMKIIFENIIEIHLLVVGKDCDIAMNGFIMDLFHQLMAHSWHVRSKYSFLVTMVTYLGSETILKLHPTMPSDVLEAMEEQTTAPYASELYEKLLMSHKQQISDKPSKTESANQQNWQEVWLPPLLKILNSKRKSSALIVQYLLPRLLKNSPDCLDYIVSYLQSSQQTHLSALITCLKVARSQGLLRKKEDCDTDTWLGVIPVSLLKQAVCHQDNQISLQALSLLCDSAKTTEVFNTVDFDLIKLFIKCNMKNQSAASRHCMMSDFKKVLLRIQEGGVVLWRQRDKEAAKTYLRQYKEFLEWLCDYSFSSLHPDACYPKRTTALGILTLLGNIYSVGTSHDKKGGVEFCFTNQWSPAHLQTVLECLTDSYVGNREMAYQLLISAPNIAQKVIHLYSIGLELANGSKPQDSVIAANLLGLVCESGAMTTEQVILDLLNSLQDHINTAKSSLLHAAANEPMYGLLYCIRTILKNKHGHIATSAIKNSMETILQLCFDAAGVVSPVVCNTSPEGYLPVNDGKDASVSLECLVFKDPVEERETKQQDDTPRVTTVTPQMVLVCCWVTMKEVSLLLGQLTQMSLDRCSLLTAQQMRNIGEFFMDLLLQARHRGAFELSYTGFEQLCSKLWRNTDKTLNKLPRQWLQTLLQEIRSASPDSQLCATRRSAGIPFAFQAILNAEPVISSERHCFREVMEQLLQLARGETITDCTFTPQVHALNILCAMYRDSKLGEDVFPFIAEGIQVAVPGFDSQIWSVRNSCMMLLNALVTRTFGVKRSKDEHSKKNQMSGREFFSRFPTLYGFLLEQIKIVTQQINNLQPSQFAVLLILSRLYSSTFDGVDSNQSSADFIPYIQQCGKSSVWKTRIMAARVLSSLTPTNRMVSMVTDLIDSLPKYVNDMTSTQNTIHGTLLQLHYLLQRYQHDHRLPDNIQEELINESLPRLQNCIWLATRDNRCNITRAAYLELIDCYILTSHQVQPHAKLTDFKQVISSTIKDEISHNPLPSHSPGCVQVEEVIAKISWKIYTAENHTDINWLSNSLTSQFYEVRLLSLNNLVELLQASSDRSDCDGLCRMCQDRNLFQLLVKMMKTEKHPDCLAQVFEALLYHNDTLVFPWATDSEELICLQVLSFLLGKLEESMNIARSDLPSSLVKLMSKFIPVIYDELTQYSSKDQHFAIFKEWINSMEMTTSIEQTTGLRLTCAHTIVNVSKCVLEDPVSVLGDAPLLLWKSVITLLQEEEEEIRQAVTPAVTASLGFGFGFKDMKSSIALTQLFDTVVSQHGKRHWETVFSFLLSYMVEDESLEDINYDEDTDGERLYDKGEANSYAERTEIIQLAASTLTKWLTEYPPLELKHVQCIQKYRTKVVNSLREFSSTLTVNTCCPFQNTSVYKHSCVVLYSLLKSVSAISLLPMTDQDMMNLKTIAKNMSSFPAVTQGTGKNYYISEILDDFTEKLKLSI
ncbi:tRNA (32-2'-O)-methyltransferase regulator THADA-like [Glandiceps talaboti]